MNELPKIPNWMRLTAARTHYVPAIGDFITTSAIWRVRHWGYAVLEYARPHHRPSWRKGKPVWRYLHPRRFPNLARMERELAASRVSDDPLAYLRAFEPNREELIQGLIQHYPDRVEQPAVGLVLTTEGIKSMEGPFDWTEDDRAYYAGDRWTTEQIAALQLRIVPLGDQAGPDVGLTFPDRPIIPNYVHPPCADLAAPVLEPVVWPTADDVSEAIKACAPWGADSYARFLRDFHAREAHVPMPPSEQWRLEPTTNFGILSESGRLAWGQKLWNEVASRTLATMQEHPSSPDLWRRTPSRFQRFTAWLDRAAEWLLRART